METGHGMNGKKRPIETSNHLTMMWSEFKGRCVLLWIKCQKSNATKSRPTSSELGADSDVDVPKTKRISPGYSAHMKNMQEVDEIWEILKQKHEENCTPEQLHTWAHMIQMRNTPMMHHQINHFFSIQEQEDYRSYCSY